MYVHYIQYVNILFFIVDLHKNLDEGGERVMESKGKQKTTNVKRETFSTGLAVFFATLGSAIGLGNIWKFPYLTGSNGGGAFVLIYILCVLLVGIPIMISEFYIGRKSRSNAVGAFSKLKAHPAWRSIGYMGVASAFLIMFFYSSVAGWVYSYVFKSVRGDFQGLADLPVDQATKIVGEQFSTAIGGAYSPMIWQLVVFAVVSAILIAGVKKGIERITKTLMPVLFVLILVICARALTLDGAAQGLNFLFHVDFSKITAPVILSALGLAFFKLSLGMGTMLTYGSYFTDDNNMLGTSAKVALSDTLVSILAGIAIFPVVFTFGMEPSAGPGLLFNTIPLVFSKMPFGNLLLTAFFVLTSIAATTAMISLVEVPVAFMKEEWKLTRNSAVLLTSGIMLAVGVLTVHPQSLFGSVTVAGKSFFDIFDYISSNLLLPVGGLLIALFVGYTVSKDKLSEELSNKGKLKNYNTIKLYSVVLKYVTPLLLLVVFLNSIGVIKL
jgi:neurotransmitter:Na+ symporter, NSS family